MDDDQPRSAPPRDDKPSLLTRFWFVTEHGFGFGVTAFDQADALHQLRDNDLLRPDQPITAVVENVDIRTLERNHVRPNMGNPVVRGIWYPHLPHTQM